MSEKLLLVLLTKMNILLELVNDSDVPNEIRDAVSELIFAIRRYIEYDRERKRRVY